MKVVTSVLAVLLCAFAAAQERSRTENIFIVTIDGFRWQEVFSGADSTLLSDTSFTADGQLSKLQYWDDDALERRKRLMPFFWNVIAKRGQVYGNRNYRNNVDVANPYKFSYPGYSEMLTGHSDPFIFSNNKKVNGNTNVLEFLQESEAYKNRVVAFSSWSLFPYILGQERNGLEVYSGYEALPDTLSNAEQQRIAKLQGDLIASKKHTRYDDLTFISAKEYIKQHEPKIVFLGLGEGDESAHHERYDDYLRNANSADKMIADLWYYIQTTPAYKDHTTLIITTDHGRGSKRSKWSKHGLFVKGSGEAWLAVIGPGIEPMGEIKTPQLIYQKQIAGTIAALLGLEFEAEHPVAKAISFKQGR